MPTAMTSRFAALASTALLLLLPALSAAQTAQIEVPADAMRSPLGDEHRQLIATYLDAQAAAMGQADQAAQVLQVRNDLLAAYRKYENINYQLPFSQLAAQKLTPLLDSDQPLKQVNIAMTLSQMAQVGVQSSLEKMLVHASPAVRFYGWQGFERIRMLVLAQGPEPVNEMFTAFQAAIAKETSACVLRAIYPVLVYDQPKPNFVGAPEYQDASQRSLDMLTNLWPRQCTMVGTADVAAIRSAQAGVRKLDALARTRAGNRDGQMPVLLMDVAMMTCAADAYKASGGEGLAADELRLLLKDLQESINLITAMHVSPITDAMKQSNAKTRSEMVAKAVQQWVSELQAAGYPVQPSGDTGAAQ